MSKFAKLYETEIGQILVKVDEGDGGAEVRFYFTPEGLGVCSIAVQFNDNWEAADKLFDEMTEQLATEHVEKALNLFMEQPDKAVGG